MGATLLWLRRDLRLTDNPALAAALRSGRRVIPVYIHAPEEEAPWIPGATSNWWLHHSLSSLCTRMAELGSRLIVRRGPSKDALLSLARETNADEVHWNRLYEPAIIARDSKIKQAIKHQGLLAESHNGALLFEPWAVENKSGNPFKVFTPFWRTCQSQFELRQPVPEPARLPPVPKKLTGLALADLGLLPKIQWDTGLTASWQPGEAAALEALDCFCSEVLRSYQKSRDLLATEGTSRVSPHLHFGEIGPNQVAYVLHETTRQLPQAGAEAAKDAYLRQVGWRDFAHHLLYHFPNTHHEPLREEFSRFPWHAGGDGSFDAWTKGMTGVPLVDAGMRQLWQSGWMHNRARMIVASFLTKNLSIHWLEGARWFWDTLVDANLASNTLGWQWTAGCGADAAPFFRIFNPIRQGERFDPDGDYIRRWVPELARLPSPYIHAPGLAPSKVLDEAGLTIGDDYPAPIVDLKTSREEALQYYRAMRQGEVA